MLVSDREPLSVVLVSLCCVTVACGGVQLHSFCVCVSVCRVRVSDL